MGLSRRAGAPPLQRLEGRGPLLTDGVGQLLDAPSATGALKERIKDDPPGAGGVTINRWARAARAV